MRYLITWCSILFAALYNKVAKAAEQKAMSPLASPTAEGTVPFVVNGEEFKTYYKIFGSLSDASSFPPIILVHGGPGLVHTYLSPLSDLNTRNARQPVIFYDQLGNGGSSRLQNRPSEFFSVRLYVEELANLVTQLGIEEYHLLGHSWGAPLIAELAVADFQPKGLKSIIITNGLTSMEVVGKSFGERLQAMENAEEIQQGMGMKDQNLTAYLDAMEKFHARYGVRFVKEKPLPKELHIMNALYGDPETGEKGDSTVSDMMDPITESWTILERIHLIRVPVLVLTGEEDFLQSYCSTPYFWKAPKAKWHHFTKSSHVPFWEERDSYMSVVSDWMAEVNGL